MYVIRVAGDKHKQRDEYFSYWCRLKQDLYTVDCIEDARLFGTQTEALNHIEKLNSRMGWVTRYTNRSFSNTTLCVVGVGELGSKHEDVSRRI